ncbi:hypothetical protein HPB47_004807 [Ixodes persulcatus]|uniref:Uncharacterized protein n=1 Tax=Ixodes persulcatus TaxID=34615 RepID=A0AC60PEM9_IXOPE|nr:hypothetical protein HPB47_004807 [Ixodes persulcatus]
MGISFDGLGDEGPGFVGIKFCQECNNMLYPKEDKENRVLLYACRNCDYQQVADNNCIYVNKITHEVDELTQIVSDVVHDPTLPRTEDHTCPKCSHREAVFFQAQSRRAEVSPHPVLSSATAPGTSLGLTSPLRPRESYFDFRLATSQKRCVVAGCNLGGVAATVVDVMGARSAEGRSLGQQSAETSGVGALRRRWRSHSLSLFSLNSLRLIVGMKTSEGATLRLLRRRLSLLRDDF